MKKKDLVNHSSHIIRAILVLGNRICSNLVELCLTLGNKDSSISKILPTPPKFKLTFIKMIIDAHLILKKII
ncbi:hypothetical protein BpHYR1_023229 [Brachionus plicatilis]|uniref:Uncharacterized protein n=1 Tax=Brachionus plicatilis TaxID=10195 RepID=A0A3M7SSI8_BRAPC|nr:hypothetical protein BpHYR1_023229 [Brachionus plicatilis]